MSDPLIPLRLQLFAILISLILLMGIIVLIRKGKLKQGYSILWFAIGIGFLIISIWSNLLRFISRLVDVEYEPATLFAVLLIGMILVMIHFTVIVSGFDQKNKTLAQFIGLLMWEIKRLKEENEGIKKQFSQLEKKTSFSQKQTK
ncbi:DUF2304 family protein [bacterium]|nr:DUF2304 family protein [bacterium]